MVAPTAAPASARTTAPQHRRLRARRSVPDAGSDAVEASGLGPTRTRVAETHISLLFFVGDRVFKLRKPVQFGFLDFRDREARRLDCLREVDLNRRLAPDVYLGVADIVVDGDPVDHMVVMRRMPADRRLATLARQGVDIDSWLSQIARMLVVLPRPGDAIGGHLGGCYP